MERKADAAKPKNEAATAVGRATPSTSPVGVLHPALKLQQTIGNLAVGRLLRSRVLQAKLAVGPVDDPLEQEADRVADHVMRLPDPALAPDLSAPSGRDGPIQRKCTACKEEEQLQRKGEGSSPGIAPPIVHEVLRSPGQPLDAPTRSFFEPRFGYDFSDVRVHTGAVAEESARDVHAHAFTVGHDIVFGASRFAPETHEGRQLIAHELSHVVQQESAPHMGRLQRTPEGESEQPSVAGVADDATEMWKDVIAQRHFHQKEGEVTFARMKILDAEGHTVVNILSESYKILSEGKEVVVHAEERAVSAARTQIGAGNKLPGGKIIFVTDQWVCPDPGRCRTKIPEFAKELDVEEASVTVFRRPALPEEPGPLAGPKPTAKKVNKKVVEGLELTSETEIIYRRDGTGGPQGGTRGTTPPHGAAPAVARPPEVATAKKPAPPTGTLTGEQPAPDAPTAPKTSTQAPVDEAARPAGRVSAPQEPAPTRAPSARTQQPSTTPAVDSEESVGGRSRVNVEVSGGSVHVNLEGGWKWAGRIGTGASVVLQIKGAIDTIDDAVAKIEKAQTGSVRPEVAPCHGRRRPRVPHGRQYVDASIPKLE